MKELRFKNAVFHKGLNLTVRAGTKWVGIRLGRIMGPTGQVLGLASIQKVIVRPFNELTDEMLILEHDPECRTVEGLYRAMIEAYGESFDPDQLVTLVYFITFLHDQSRWGSLTA